MPTNWTIDHNSRMLTAVAEGAVTRVELEDYLAAVVKAGTMSYRKLFDGRDADVAMSDEELIAIGARLRAYQATGPMGPLTIVVAGETTQGLARLFGALAAADRAIKLFREREPARRWIEAQPA